MQMCIFAVSFNIKVTPLYDMKTEDVSSTTERWN